MFVLDEKLRTPELRGITWLNSAPVTMAALRGRVVLLDFWDYTCINCLHTLPYLKAWHERYADLGLTIIGLHAPEFAFSKDAAQVEKAVAQLGIPYPVGLDNDFITWNAYANRAWPAKYLIDPSGYLKAYHFGEGAYALFEEEIQGLIRTIHPEASLPQPLNPVRDIDEPGVVCYRPTPELYLGYHRGEVGNREGNPPETTLTYPTPPEQGFLDTVYLEGAWTHRKEYAESATHEPAKIHVTYRAKAVNLVMNPTGDGPTEIRLWQDGAMVPIGHRGEDTSASGDATTVLVTEPRMYRLIDNPGFETHRLTLEVCQAGLQAYAFTFVSCVSEESAIA